MYGIHAGEDFFFCVNIIAMEGIDTCKIHVTFLILMQFKETKS